MRDDAARVPTNEELALEWIDAHAHASISGQGGDDALFHVAAVLYHGFDLGNGALDLLRHYNATKCSPAWSEGRLAYKVKQAAGAAQKHAPGGLARWMLRKKGLRVGQRMPEATGAAGRKVANEPRFEERKRQAFDLAKLRHEVRDVPVMVNEAWLAEVSPVKVGTCSTAEFLEALYPKGERVLIFTDFYSQGQFMHWCGRGSFRLARRPGMKAVKSDLPAGGPEGVWFLNQPVSGEWKPNPRSLDAQGRPKMSRRSEEVVTAWRYLVLESDDAPADLWIRLLCKLPLPIAAIYTSGGRSIHALVRLDAPSKEWWDRYKKLIVPLLSLLGADPAAITAVRLTRLPGCMRGEKMQRLLYLDPHPDPAGVPILWREGGAA